MTHFRKGFSPVIHATRPAVSVVPFVLAAFGLLVGCGSKDSQESIPEYTDGTAPDEWADYCVATFAEDFDVIQFHETFFTAKSGENYLISAIDETELELLFITPAGYESFRVPAGEDSPVTASCTTDDSEARYVALADVTVYADEEVSEVLCEIEAGDAVPSTGSHYFAAVSFDLSDESIYEVSLGGFTEQCGGAQAGYIVTPRVKLFDTFTWLIPLAVVRHPI